jgi:hypothetical protein
LDKNGAYVVRIDLADECCTALRRTHDLLFNFDHQRRALGLARKLYVD